jgi:dCMP deaminase
MNRQKWDDYFLSIASAVAMRATCPRASVGAVIVRDKRIIATGYNGSAPGEPHCTDVGCLMKDGHCQRAIHAETNAVAQCARFGIPTDGATLYYWDSQCRPYDDCVKCTQIMKAAGIVRIVGR